MKSTKSLSSNITHIVVGVEEEEKVVVCRSVVVEVAVVV